MSFLSRSYSTSSSFRGEETSRMEGSMIKRQTTGLSLKIQKKSIYKHSGLGLIPDIRVKIEEKTISMSNDHEVISMITKEMVKTYRPKYEFIHIGLVQVAVKPLVRGGLDIALLLCLRDGRITEFQDSLLGIYFNCHTDLTVKLKDKNILKAIELDIKLHGFKALPGSFSHGSNIQNLLQNNE